MLKIPPALKHRNFRYLWLGLIISIAGSQMQFVTIHWHIRELTGEPNPLALGGIGLARILPVVLFSAFGGVFADSYDRRKILFVTQSAQALVAAGLAWLTLFGHIQIWHIYLLTAIQGAASAFDMPARQSMVPNLVAKEDVPNAFNMNNIAFNLGAVLGPVLAGMVIANMGLAYTYIFNAISFLGPIIALMLLRDVPQDLQKNVTVSWRSIVDGVKFIYQRKLIFATMITDFFATFFASANTMMPIIARDILQVGSIGYGWLMSAEAVGSVMVGLILSQVNTIKKQGMVFLVSVAIFGLATILFGVSRWFGVTLIALFVMGASDSVSAIIRSTIRQLQTPDHMRGRMTSINQIFFYGGPQLGEVEAGVLGKIVGIPAAIAIGGVGTIIALIAIIFKYPMLKEYDNHLTHEA